MTEYDYDPNLPYVVATKRVGGVYAKFKHRGHANEFVGAHSDFEVIDTTPAPRVPEDALWIAYSQYGTSKTESWELTLASRQEDLWFPAGEEQAVPLEDLPGVTPETRFTVLDERKS